MVCFDHYSFNALSFKFLNKYNVQFLLCIWIISKFAWYDLNHIFHHLKIYSICKTFSLCPISLFIFSRVICSMWGLFYTSNFVCQIFGVNEASVFCYFHLMLLYYTNLKLLWTIKTNNQIKLFAISVNQCKIRTGSNYSLENKECRAFSVPYMCQYLIRKSMLISVTMPDPSSLGICQKSIYILQFCLFFCQVFLFFFLLLLSFSVLIMGDSIRIS